MLLGAFLLFTIHRISQATFPMEKNISQIKQLTYIAEFAAVIGLSSLLVLPIGPVPVTLQTLLIAYAGLFLGPKGAVMSVLVYLVAGALGVPIFAGGKSGIGVLFGPSAGYLWGFLLIAYFAGLAKGKALFPSFLLLLTGLILDHLLGIAGLMLTLKKTLVESFMIDVLFIPGDLIKICLALILWRATEKRLSR